MTVLIRPYQDRDFAQLYTICLKTGKAGNDATGLIDDQLLGHFYAAPYALFEPNLCFVVEQDKVVAGYILGTSDSATFANYCEHHWWPALREQYPMPAPTDTSWSADMIREIHEGYQAPNQLENYPAHLHIDLLPNVQSQGFGKQLIKAFLDELRGKSVAGVHFGVAANNTAAIGFYQHLGFNVLSQNQHSIIFGLRI